MKKTIFTLLFLVGLPVYADSSYNGCWEAFIEDGGNTSIICIYYDQAMHSVFYPNSKKPGDETVCLQSSAVKFQENEINLIFKDGPCENGRKIAEESYRCKVSSNSMKCVRDYGQYESFYKRLVQN